MIIKLLFLLLLPLIVAFVTLLERKVLGISATRLSVNKVGLSGLLQPLLDAVKLLGKELVLPNRASLWGFVLAPLGAYLLAMSFWESVMVYGLSEVQFMVVFFLIVISLNVLVILLLSLSSGSKFSYLGALRACLTSVSFEVVLGLAFFVIQSFNQTLFFSLSSASLFLLVGWLVLVLSELMRTPVDLGEAESELVSGVNLELSSLTFVFFFLAEYANVLFLGVLTSILFFWGSCFAMLVFFLLFCRCVLPRLKVDTLLSFVWLRILPLEVLYLLFWVGVLL